MEVTYINNGKNAYFQGKRYTRDDRHGYYKRIEANHPKYLHRRVYEAHFGSVPEGYHVHHVDGNKGNNEIENLALLTEHDHQSEHWKRRTPEQKKAYVDKLRARGVPAAVAWHKSEAGREWHKQHYEAHKDSLRIIAEFTCLCCGKTFIAQKTQQNKFCSNNCKSAYRRKIGADDIQKTCAICGRLFYDSKYSTVRSCSRECGRALRLITLRANKEHKKASGAGSL